mmetsp:Transcript_7049/g.18108  ORF Transcript_7049/g.18108 Transcript_7049/m.18108 type:complete len:143 (-) Transcript_7049:5297-5725(-)
MKNNQEDKQEFGIFLNKQNHSFLLFQSSFSLSFFSFPPGDRFAYLPQNRKKTERRKRKTKEKRRKKIGEKRKEKRKKIGRGALKTKREKQEQRKNEVRYRDVLNNEFFSSNPSLQEPPSGSPKFHCDWQTASDNTMVCPRSS